MEKIDSYTQERYSRQIVYEKIGKEKQEKLFTSRIVIIGAGALGSVIANNLCRAGIGYLRLVDEDNVELSNLPRQILFNEEDAKSGLSKAAVSCTRLAAINSNIVLEPVTVHVDSSNIEELIQDADCVLDATDNLEIRFIINEACHTLKKPWVHGAVLGAAGNCITIIPGEGPCFRCYMPELPSIGSYPTTATHGVLNMITGIIASMESMEAIKIITGSSDINRQLFVMDLWNNTAEYLEILKNPGCPVCGN